MTKIQEILEKSLDAKEIAELGKETRFTIRKGGKIQPLNFILSFFAVFSVNQLMSLNNWSSALSFLLGDTVSKQALSQKFYDRHLNFIQKVLKHVMSKKMSYFLKKSVHLENTQELFKDFNRVFVRDSTCIKLDSSLSEFFPSSFRQTGQGATAKIQTAYNLKAFEYHYYDLGSYRDTDGKKAESVFEYAEEGDLVMEDLGYQSFDNYKKLMDKGIYLVTKWKYGTILFTEQEEERIDLLALLREKGEIDMVVKMGVEHKIKVRIVAKKLPKKVAQKRKKEARKNRHSKAKHAQNYLDFLEWDIVITTVPDTIWTAEQVLTAYRLRWHIEIIFKAWKSKLNFDKIVTHKMNANQCKTIIYLALLYVFLRSSLLFQFFQQQVRIHYKNKELSLLKFYDFLQTFLVQIQKVPLELSIKIVVKHACYDKQPKRKNHHQLLSG